MVSDSASEMPTWITFVPELTGWALYEIVVAFPQSGAMTLPLRTVGFAYMQTYIRIHIYIYIYLYIYMQ